jgi:hypothetical protein
MSVPEAFVWSPHLAVALGGLAGLGARRSWRIACVSVGLALLVQSLAWPILFVAAEIAEKGWGKDWQIVLGVGFLRGLLLAFPYTVIGAVGGGVLAGLVRCQRSRSRAERGTSPDRDRI